MASDKTMRFVALVTGRDSSHIKYLQNELDCSRQNVYRLFYTWSRTLPIRMEHGSIINIAKKKNGG
jgi:hypothetical protein